MQVHIISGTSFKELEERINIFIGGCPDEYIHDIKFSGEVYRAMIILKDGVVVNSD